MGSMFTKSSRYDGIKYVEAVGSNGRKVSAVFLRRILRKEGELINTQSNDRLDIISSDKYGDPTMFWHIADANTELDTNNLIANTGKIKSLAVPST